MLDKCKIILLSGCLNKNGICLDMCKKCLVLQGWSPAIFKP